MTTHKAKICYGWVNGSEWVLEHTYLIKCDGYPENIIPILKGSVERDIADRYIHLDSFNDVTNVDYIYCVEFCLNEVRCTILELDYNFYLNYGVCNYNVVKELLL